MRTHRLHEDEQGTVLVVVLMFLGVWSFVIFALLGLAEVGFDTTAAQNRQTAEVYASEGAAEIAIAYLAANPAEDCAGSDALAELQLNDGQFDGERVHVFCELFVVSPQIPWLGGVNADRVADLEVRLGDAGEQPVEDWPVQLLARVLFDDAAHPAHARITNWRVVR